jgi:hypothetical protein
MPTGCKQHYQRGPIDEEADKQGELFWAKSFSKCGDSFFAVYARNGIYSQGTPEIYQFKDPSFFTYHKMDDKVFTEADRLNGIEWVGETHVFCKAHRIYRNGQWSDWYDYAPSGLYDRLNTTVRKVKENWVFGITDKNDRFIAIPCDKVPQ